MLEHGLSCKAAGDWLFLTGFCCLQVSEADPHPGSGAASSAFWEGYLGELTLHCAKFERFWAC